MGLINWEKVKDLLILGVFFLGFFALFLALGFGNVFVSLNWGVDIPALNTSDVPDTTDIQNPFTGFSENVTVGGIEQNGDVRLLSNNTSRSYPLLGVSVITDEQEEQILPSTQTRRGCYAGVIDETNTYLNSFTKNDTFQTVPFVLENQSESAVEVQSMVVLEKETNTRLGKKLAERGLAVVTNKSAIAQFREEGDGRSPVVKAQRNASEENVGIWSCEGMKEYTQTWNYE